VIVEDKQLIAQYAVTGAESPFSELVRRHINLVYSTALRHVNGDTHLAEDVAQTVFADLARKAKTLTSPASLAGWLYTSARFAAANAVRAESRRRAREQEAIAMLDATANPPPRPERRPDSY
jgi:RNA polymerase sigma factor (sigma-70 family)